MNIPFVNNNIKKKRYGLFYNALRISVAGLYIYCFLLSVPTSGQEIQHLNIPYKDTNAILKEIDYAKQFVAPYPDSALKLMHLPLQQSRQQYFYYGNGIILLHMGSAYINKGLYEQAELLYKEAIHNLEKSGWGRREIPRAICELGNVFVLKGSYEQALKHYYDALNIAKKELPDLNIDFIYSNMARVLIQMGRDPQSAHYYFDKAEEIAKKYSNYFILCKVYNNKGVAFVTHKKWDSSLYYFNKAYELSLRENFPDMQFLTLSNFGVVYLEQHKGDSALIYLQKSKPFEMYVSIPIRERVRAMWGVAYLQTKQYRKAMPLLLRQFEEAKRSEDKVQMREAHYNLAQLYGALKDYRKAYHSAWSYIRLNDSMGGEEIIKNVNNMEVAFRTAEKEKTIFKNKLLIAQQEQELANKDKWMILFVSCGVILLLVLFFTWRAYYSRQKFIAQKLHNMEQRREIENLKATIKGEENERLRIARELHDGIGGLISAAKMNLVALGKENNSITTGDIYQSTEQILAEVSDELRLTAHNMMPKALMEKDLVEAITSFCNYTRQHKNINIEMQAYGRFDGLPDAVQLGIYRIIQELVHNVVKHARASRALVQLALQDNIISITVEDNGKGMDPRLVEEGNGVGLESVKTRVKSMNGTYSVNTGPGKGTSFYIEFELDAKIGSYK